MSEVRHPRLLLTLKVTIESLLQRGESQVWNVYGSLNRVCMSLIDIMTHGFKLCDDEGKPDLWTFIQGLSWLQPALSGWEPPCHNSLHYPEHVRCNKGLLWIYWHVENHTVCDKLSWLTSDRQHLLQCYQPTSFMCNYKYSEALLVCLKALEQGQSGILAELDPSLYILPSGPFSRAHRRCSSFPQTKPQEMEMPVFKHNDEGIPENLRITWGFGMPYRCSFPVTDEPVRRAPQRRPPMGRRCYSLPAVINPVIHEPAPRLRSKTESKISPSALQVDYSESARKTRQQRRRRERPDKHQKSFLNAHDAVRPAATGYFPRPSEGQSLASYLSSSPFPSAELDRENAHFLICEAMISAVEQVKCNEAFKQLEQSLGITLNEQLFPGPQFPEFDFAGFGQVPVYPSTSRGGRRPHTLASRLGMCPPGSSSEADHTHWPVHSRFRKSFAPPRTPSSSGDRETASEITPTPPSSSESDSDSERELGSDADQVALSLLKQFKHSDLPRASELKWLVAAGDTPQEMLPLPNAPSAPRPTALRGTADWAPPRAQLIFTVHPSPKKKAMLSHQKLRCAGCGCTVAPEYASRFRYCEYLGRYFCTGCHSNQTSIIPGRIIHNWDFNRYPVATFSWKLIDQMMADPLFRLDDLNPTLYKKVKALDRARNFRLQLHFLKDFLLSCRFADHLKELIMQQPSYGLSEPDRFSIVDLQRVKSGDLIIDLQALLKTGLAHVDTCDLCQARGFMCELCPCKAVIFPWNLQEVYRCDGCGACFHKKCYRTKMACQRCLRMAARRSAKQSKSPDVSLE